MHSFGGDIVDEIVELSSSSNNLSANFSAEILFYCFYSINFPCFNVNILNSGIVGAYVSFSSSLSSNYLVVLFYMNLMLGLSKLSKGWLFGQLKGYGSSLGLI